MTEKHHSFKTILTILAILSPIIFVPYFTLTLREILTYKNENLGLFVATVTSNVILLVIEIVVTIYGLYFINSGIKALDYHFRIKTRYFSKVQGSELPRVSIIIPVKNKNPIELEKTLVSLSRQTYPKGLLQIIISSNSTNADYIKEYLRLCKVYSAEYVSIPPMEKGFKARVLNEGLQRAAGEYVIILDADHIAAPQMTMKFVSAFLSLPREVRQKVAYFQAKATFGETNTYYQKASSILLTHFYEVFEKAKHQNGTVIFNGSTACFQIDALKRINGFPMDTYTEDSDASVMLLVHGYRGLFLDEHLSRGKTPDSFQDQVSQLWRWTHGAGSIFRLRTNIIVRSKELSLFQKMDLLLSVSILFAAIGAVGIPILIILMVALNLPILRPTLPNYGTLALGPASMVMLAHFLTALMAIYWEYNTTERRVNNNIRRLFDLVAYYFLSLASFFFIIGAFVKGILLKDNALESGAKWDRNMTLWPPYFSLLIITGLALFSAWKIVTLNIIEYYPLITLFLTFPLSLLMISLDIRR